MLSPSISVLTDQNDVKCINNDIDNECGIDMISNVNDSRPSLSENKNERKGKCSNEHENKLWRSDSNNVYEEAFRTSNVPQIIATLGGKIVACK